MYPLTVIVLLVLTHGLFVQPVDSSGINVQYEQLLLKRFKFLFFTPLVDTSHYYTMTRSATVLGQQGHKVVFLRSSSGAEVQTSPDDPFSIVVFNSSLTRQDRKQVFQELSKVAFKKPMTNLFLSLKKKD